MKAPIGFMRNLVALAGLASGLSASAHGLVAFYQVGGDQTEWVRWDTYAIDSDSLVLEGNYLKYKSTFITTHGGPPPESIKVDCKSKRRAPASSADLYATYDGTIAGEEVKAACALAVQQGLLKQ
jgi:hypothetical protein